jgi:hypothetical protein
MADAPLSRIVQRLRQPFAVAATAGTPSGDLPERRSWLFCDESGASRQPGGPHSCGVCRRTILSGERTQVFVVDERRIEVCPLCALRLSKHGLGQAA